MSASVTEVNVVDFGADPTGVTACDDAIDSVIAFVASSPRSSVYFPAGDYRTTRTMGPFPVGCIIRGDGLSGEGVAGRPYASGTRILCCGPGVGLQLGRGSSSNMANPTILRDLEVLGALDTGWADYPNINDVGIEILGDVGVTVQDVRTGGFRYQYSLDGSEVCKIVRPMCDGGFQGHGYQDMMTDLGDDSAIAIRIGSFKFTVPGSANSNTITSAYFSNSRIGYYHQGGIGNSISKVAGQIAVPFWVQSGTAPLIEGYSGEALDPLCTILVRGGGLIAGFVVRNMQFMQKVPAILFDPATPSTILGLDFAGNYCGQMGTWTFPIVNAAPHLIGVHCPPSTVLPTDGFAAGALCDSFSSVQDGVLGVQLNGSEKAQGALDVIAVDYVNPLLRLRSGPYRYLDVMPPASGRGKHWQTVRRVYSDVTSREGAVEVSSIGRLSMPAASPVGFTAAADIPADGAGTVTIEVTGYRVDDPTKVGLWRIRQRFCRAGGALILVGLPTTECADADETWGLVAPSIAASGYSVQAALTSHATVETVWAATTTVLEAAP